MITVRVNSVSSGSGYPRIVYNSRHERMGDAMILNGARGEPNRFEKNNRAKERERERERSEEISKLGVGGRRRGRDVNPGSVSKFCGNNTIQGLRQGLGTLSAVGVRQGGNLIC